MEETSKDKTVPRMKQNRPQNWAKKRSRKLFGWKGCEKKISLVNKEKNWGGFLFWVVTSAVKSNSNYQFVYAGLKNVKYYAFFYSQVILFKYDRP